LGPWICLPKGIISLCAVVAGFLIRNPFNGLDFGFWAVPAVLVLAAAGFLNGLLLEARGIGKSYPGVVALKAVDLAVYPNEILGLVGENGAGKSTLMKILK
jgi:ABC-type multidrug transport system fused ATPase/permease subunit